MKKLLLAITLIGGTLLAKAQYPEVSIMDIKTVSQTDLQNCEDDPQFLEDTVTVVGVMLHDGNLSDVSSSSVQGGHRPQVFIRDTSNNAAPGEFKTILLQGVYEDGQGNALPVTQVNDLFAGDVVRVTGIVNEFRGQVQLDILSPSDIQTIGAGSGNFTPTTVEVGELNDENRENNLPTGEQYEGDFVRVENVTVIAVDRFSGRVNFDVQDADGNVVNIYDLFVVQKAEGLETANPKSPQETGTFEAPVVGTVFESISGIVQHEENGCASSANFRRGYRINPFLESHYVKGATPPSVSLLTNIPELPTSSDDVSINATATDSDGEITSVTAYYSVNGGDSTTVSMSLKSGSTEEYEVAIGSFNDGDLVSYFVIAEDNEGNLTRLPSGSNRAYFHVKDNGLGIFEIQQIVFNGQERSGYEGKTVTVSGVAISTLADLGYVYIQDPNFSRFAGIQLAQNENLGSIQMNDQVTVTGIVAEESFGGTSLTVIEVESFNVTGQASPITPVYFDPSTQNGNSVNLEDYEGMLVGLASSNGASMFMGDPDLGFGEYGLSSVENPSDDEVFRVLSARQSGFANSSLNVSLVTDSFYIANDGAMNVDPILTNTVNSVDTLVGVLYDSFGSLKVTPRSNDDVRMLTTAVYELDKNVAVSVYPNPANDVVNISLPVNASLRLLDISGSVVTVQDLNQGVNTINLTGLKSGIYFGSVVTAENATATFKVVKK